MDPEALQAMLPYFEETYGNASSINHSFGKKAAEAVELARNEIGTLLDADAKQLLFTSGSTESINLALKGVFNRYQSIGKHIITCATEHKAVLDTCAFLERKGAEITYLPVTKKGEISLADLEASIRKDTILLCFMHANNETGTLHPIEEIAEIANKHQVLFFCDATQSIGKLPLSLRQLPIDMLACSAHKLHGPKGIGVLYVRRKNRRIQLEPLLHGGSQENSLRAGTLNVPAIVGFGKAAQLARTKYTHSYEEMSRLRDALESSLLSLPETFINGNLNARMANVSNLTFRHISAAQLMRKIPNMAFSSGSACTTGTLEPSHVLIASGLSKEDARATVRLSLSRFTTLNEIDSAINLLTNAVTELRNESPAWMLHQQGLLGNSN